MMLVTSAAKAEEFGLPVNGRLVSAAVSGVDPAYMGIGMVPASLKALEKAGLTIDDIDVVEANEAYASVALRRAAGLKVPDEKMNPVGGQSRWGTPSEPRARCSPSRPCTSWSAVRPATGS